MDLSEEHSAKCAKPNSKTRDYSSSSSYLCLPPQMCVYVHMCTYKIEKEKSDPEGGRIVLKKEGRKKYRVM